MHTLILGVCFVFLEVAQLGQNTKINMIKRSVLNRSIDKAYEFKNFLHCQGIAMEIVCGQFVHYTDTQSDFLQTG